MRKKYERNTKGILRNTKGIQRNTKGILRNTKGIRRNAEGIRRTTRAILSVGGIREQHKRILEEYGLDREATMAMTRAGTKT